MIEKIKNKEFIVREILTKYPKARDNDSLLLAHVWVYQCGGKSQCENISMWEFVLDFVKKNFAEVSGITRCRRKIQEKEPELRGELYEKRHRMKESIKEEIVTWDEEQSSLFKS
ncbi:MAG: hypothetical protein Unbinned4139contig1000_4 [Prokaryotic dsDNA virus sp.]|nr:MAG: hypothetical protein Unbinned4139contig1000_4 [Prokaryotic dsDNA virus sp.]